MPISLLQYCSIDCLSVPVWPQQLQYHWLTNLQVALVSHYRSCVLLWYIGGRNSNYNTLYLQICRCKIIAFMSIHDARMVTDKCVNGCFPEQADDHPVSLSKLIRLQVLLKTDRHRGLNYLLRTCACELREILVWC